MAALIGQKFIFILVKYHVPIKKSMCNTSLVLLLFIVQHS